MNSSEQYLTLAGRFLMGFIFVASGIHKIVAPETTRQYMESYGLDMATTWLYLGAILVEVGGGLCLLLGFHTRRAALLLILFMVPTTSIFHTNFEDQNQMIHFLKNLAMTGGLFYVVAYGPGKISLDARSRIRHVFSVPLTRT